MSKLGYDETNFTDAIVDLGRCEMETKRLNGELKLLQETINDLKQKELYLMNEIDNLRFQNSEYEHLKYIENDVSENYQDNWYQTKKLANLANNARLEQIKNHRNTNISKIREKDAASFKESRFAPGTVQYMMAKERFEKNINKGGTKNKKVRNQCKTKKYKHKNR